MNILESYSYIPISPIEYAKLLKIILKGKSIEETAIAIDKSVEYIKYMLAIYENYARGIQKFMQENKLSIEETGKLLNLTEKQIDDYLSLL